MSIEEDRIREERREEVRREERKTDREHELQIARIYAEAFARSQSRTPERPANSIYPTSSPSNTLENSYTQMFSPTASREESNFNSLPRPRLKYNPMDSSQAYSRELFTRTKISVDY